MRERRVAAALGIVAGLILAGQLVWLDALQWCDAYVTSYLDAVRGCTHGTLPTVVSKAAPYLGAAFLVMGAAVARARRAQRADVLWILGVFGLGLLSVEALKLVCERGRPGTPPWLSAGNSFPSGHVANVALCVGAALRLAQSGRWGERAPFALLVGGLVYVPSVAFTRVYLGRHWLTDVTASMLLGVCFWSIAGVGRTPAVRWLVCAAALFVLAGACLAAASGGRIHLASPATVARHPRFSLRLRHPRLLDGAGVEGRWMPARARGGRGFFRLESSELRFAVHTPRNRRGVLKLVARPLDKSAGTACRWIELFVDSDFVVGRPLRSRWHTYAFALPPLPGGSRELTVRVIAPGRTAGTGLHALALRRVTVEEFGAPAVAVASPAPRMAVRPHVARAELEWGRCDRM